MKREGNLRFEPESLRYQFENVPVTGRSFEQYRRIFDLEEAELKEYLRGKVIVDLGAGSSDFIATILRENISDKAYAVDMLYDKLPLPGNEILDPEI